VNADVHDVTVSEGEGDGSFKVCQLLQSAQRSEAGHPSARHPPVRVPPSECHRVVGRFGALLEDVILGPIFRGRHRPVPISTESMSGAKARLIDLGMTSIRDSYIPPSLASRMGMERIFRRGARRTDLLRAQIDGRLEASVIFEGYGLVDMGDAPVAVDLAQGPWSPEPYIGVRCAVGPGSGHVVEAVSIRTSAAV